MVRKAHMAIFVVFKVSHPHQMHAAIARAFPFDHSDLGDNEWLISARGTAQEVSNKLGLTPGNDLGSAIVFSMQSYYGRASTNVWDWIKTKAEETNG
jgi:hypothetical protein